MSKTWEELRDEAASDFDAPLCCECLQDKLLVYKAGANFGREQGILEERASVHSCHDQCEREACKLRRELETERARNVPKFIHIDQTYEHLSRERAYTESIKMFQKHIIELRDQVEVWKSRASINGKRGFESLQQHQAERARAKGLVEALRNFIVLNLKNTTPHLQRVMHSKCTTKVRREK